MTASDVARRIAYNAKADLNQLSNVVIDGGKKVFFHFSPLPFLSSFFFLILTLFFSFSLCSLARWPAVCYQTCRIDTLNYYCLSFICVIGDCTTNM